MINTVITLTHPSCIDTERHAIILSSLVKGVPPVFCSSFLKLHQWICVGIEDELEGEAVCKLAKACADAGFTHGWSVEIPWNAEQEIVASYQHRLTDIDIKSVTKNAYLGSCYVIVEESLQFAVASDGDLYWMLAGPQAFVEASIDCSVKMQLSAFDAVVASYNSHKSLAGERLAIVQKLSRNCYQEANDCC